jgi:transposase
MSMLHKVRLLTNISTYNCYFLNAGRRAWESDKWQIHHDNAPAHWAQFVWQFLANCSIQQFRRPPRSSDLAPCESFLFSEIKSILKGKIMMMRK